VAVDGLCGVPGVSALCGAARGAVSSIGNDFIQTAAQEAAKAADSLLKTLATAWTQIATPTAADCSTAPNGTYTCTNSSGGNGGAIQFIQGDLKFVTLFVGVAAIIVAAARMAFLRRGEPMREAASGLLRLVVVTGMGLAFISIMAQAGDSFAAYVLKSIPSSKSGDLAQATTLFKLSGGGTSAIAPFLLLILGLLAILATLVQLFLIVVRGALLVVIAGVWPLSAAASMTGAGQTFFRKTLGYLIAFLIYKPAAAVVYALAFYLIQNPPGNADPILTQIEGVALIVLATLTLPALLKFVVPAVASAGGVGAAEAIGGGLALATGAAAIAGGGGGAAARGAGGGARMPAVGGAMSGGQSSGPPGASTAAGKGGPVGVPGSSGTAGGGGGAAARGAGGGGRMAAVGVGAGGQSSGPPGASTAAGKGGPVGVPGSSGTAGGQQPAGKGPAGADGAGPTPAGSPSAPGGGASGSGAVRARQVGQSVGGFLDTATGAADKQMGGEEIDG